MIQIVTFKDINGMNTELWKSFTYGGVNITGFQLVKASHRHSALTELLEEDQQPSVRKLYLLFYVEAQNGIILLQFTKVIHTVIAWTY